MMQPSDGVMRAKALECYEAIPSLDVHGELTRLILAEVSLLTEKYRYVKRHDVPHIAELSGLLDVLWQEIEMVGAIGAQLAADNLTGEQGVSPAAAGAEACAQTT